MKKQYGLVGFMMVGLLGAAMAHADVPSVQESPDFWKKLNTLVAQCAVKPYTEVQGVKTYRPLRSVCHELQADGSRATFILEGEYLSAQIDESPEADGGDLDNVYVQNSEGTVVAQRQNVLAYGDILLGLAGGNVDAQEILAP